jgi:hypothetical protein
MFICKCGGRVALIDWPVKYKHREVVGLAYVEHYNGEISNAVTITIAGYRVWVIIRNGLPPAPVSCTDGSQILFAFTVLVASEPITWMVA